MKFYSVKSKAEKIDSGFHTLSANSNSAISTENRVTWTTVCHGM